MTVRNRTFEEFGRRQGADENFRLFRVGIDGNEEKELTPGPKLHRPRPRRSSSSRWAGRRASFTPIPRLRSSRKRAPLFVYAGANDPRVPRTESDQIVSALRSRNVPVEYMVAENEGHSLDRREDRIEFYTRVARFLEENVK